MNSIAGAKGSPAIARIAREAAPYIQDLGSDRLNIAQVKIRL